jgi:hypothetical protein
MLNVGPVVPFDLVLVQLVVTFDKCLRLLELYFSKFNHRFGALNLFFNKLNDLRINFVIFRL